MQGTIVNMYMREAIRHCLDAHTLTSNMPRMMLVRNQKYNSAPDDASTYGSPRVAILVSEA